MSHYQIKMADSDLLIKVTGRVSVLDSCLEGGIALPYNCRSGECGECIATLVSGEVKELKGADPAIFNDSHRAEGKILACMCYPQSDLVLSTSVAAKAGTPIGQHQVQVTDVVRHGASIYEVRFQSEEPIEYQAGQYFDWVVPGIPDNRSYSAANRPGSRDLVFHIKTYQQGEVSQYLAQGKLRPGDTLTLNGPFGSFGLSEQHESPAVMVAGGTGLAPLCALLEESFARRHKRHIHLFIGAHSPDELYCQDQLEQWASEYKNLSIQYIVANPGNHSDWTGEEGLVTDLLAQKLSDAMGYEAYLCGPPAMIDAASELLVAKGIDKNDLHMDRFLAVA